MNEEAESAPGFQKIIVFLSIAFFKFFFLSIAVFLVRSAGTQGSFVSEYNEGVVHSTHIYTVLYLNVF